MTDQDLLTELQNAMVETANGGASWPSGLWTVDELSGYLNQRQQRLLYATGCVLTRTTLATSPSVNRQPLPTDWIQTRRAVFLDAAGVYHPLLRSENWGLDYGLPSWQSTLAPVPLVFNEDMTPSLEIQVAPATSDAGVLQILYVALGALLSNTGVVFAVPADLVPVVKWGVIADLLGKLNRAQDVQRTQYAEQRFAMGIAAVNLLLWGSPDGVQP